MDRKFFKWFAEVLKHETPMYHVHDFVALARANNKIYLDCACGRRKVTDRDQFAAQEVTYSEAVYFADKCLIDASTIAVPPTLK